MKTVKSLICLLATIVSLTAAGDARIDMSAERLTKEGRKCIRWVECRYEHWTALACWRHSDKERVTSIQIFIPGPDTSWVCLHDENIPYAANEADRIDHIDAVPIGRVFMVIDRSEMLSFSYLGYDEAKEPNKSLQPTATAVTPPAGQEARQP